MQGLQYRLYGGDAGAGGQEDFVTADFLDRRNANFRV